MKTKFPVARTSAHNRGLCAIYCLASAGPNANVTGIRKYWGKDAPIIRCGQFIYLMSEQNYYRFKGDK